MSHSGEQQAGVRGMNYPKGPHTPLPPRSSGAAPAGHLRLADNDKRAGSSAGTHRCGGAGDGQQDADWRVAPLRLAEPSSASAALACYISLTGEVSPGHNTASFIDTLETTRSSSRPLTFSFFGLFGIFSALRVSFSKKLFSPGLKRCHRVRLSSEGPFSLPAI